MASMEGTGCFRSCSRSCTSARCMPSRTWTAHKASPHGLAASSGKTLTRSRSQESGGLSYMVGVRAELVLGLGQVVRRRRFAIPFPQRIKDRAALVKGATDEGADSRRLLAAVETLPHQKKAVPVELDPLDGHA